LVVLLIAAGLGYALQSFNVERVQRSAQKILDRDLEENALAVDVVNTPIGFRAFLSASPRSYLFLAGKNGRVFDPKKCPLTTDYEVKLSGTNTLEGGRFAVRVYFERLQECSDALKANGS
jgi:hypothetical protein